MSTAIIAPDLTQRPPRSPRVRLGGYVLLPRILDKGRAALAGKLGEYHYSGKGMDRHFFNFVGLDHESLKAELAKGGGDWEILNWIQANAKHQRQPWEINATWLSACAAGTAEGQVARVLATQSVVLSLRGVPALYLPVLLAARNDHQRVEATGDNRAINRGRLEAPRWEKAAAQPGSVEAKILEGMKRLLRARGSTPAFHPEGAQRVVDLGNPAVLGLERTAPDGRESVLCATNFSAHPATIRTAGRQSAGSIS